MQPIPSTPRSAAAIDGIVNMLLAACESPSVYERLEMILALPNLRRRAELNAVISDLLMAQAPQDLITALACLVDEEVAEKAYEVIYKCHRGEMP